MDYDWQVKTIKQLSYNNHKYEKSLRQLTQTVKGLIVSRGSETLIQPKGLQVT